MENTNKLLVIFTLAVTLAVTVSSCKKEDDAQPTTTITTTTTTPPPTNNNTPPPVVEPTRYRYTYRYREGGIEWKVQGCMTPDELATDKSIFNGYQVNQSSTCPAGTKYSRTQLR